VGLACGCLSLPGRNGLQEARLWLWFTPPVSIPIRGTAIGLFIGPVLAILGSLFLSWTSASAPLLPGPRRPGTHGFRGIPNPDSLIIVGLIHWPSGSAMEGDRGWKRHMVAFGALSGILAFLTAVYTGLLLGASPSLLEHTHSSGFVPGELRVHGISRSC